MGSITSPPQGYCKNQSSAALTQDFYPDAAGAATGGGGHRALPDGGLAWRPLWPTALCLLQLSVGSGDAGQCREAPSRS